MKKKRIRKLVKKVVHEHSRKLVPDIVKSLMQYTDKAIDDTLRDKNERGDAKPKSEKRHE